MIKVTGRVLAVNFDEDASSFTVTLGPTPDLFWFRSTERKPPKLGQRIIVYGIEGAKQSIGAGIGAGSITTLDQAHFEIVKDVPIVRVIAPAWIERVSDVMRRQLYRYQVEGAAWLCSRITAGVGGILGDEMGCVDGEAIIRVCRAGNSFELKLSELHRKFHGGKTFAGVWDPAIPTHVRALCNGEFRLHPIRNVVASGRKTMLLLTLSSGKTLRLTADHEVCVSTDGQFKRCDKLSTGDTVVTNGTATCACGSDKNVVTSPYAKYPGYCRTCIYRKLRAKPTFIGGKSVDQDGYVRVSGMHDHPRSHGGHVYEHILVAESMVGRFITRDEAVHHKNGNTQDNRPENLEVLPTHGEHGRRHGKEGGYRHLDGGISAKGGTVVFVPKLDTVASVREDGDAEAFDIVCEDPHRNFVANGIVVHNCGKTSQAVAALCAVRPYPALIVCPASLKLHWAREFGWAKEPPKVSVISGIKRPIVPGADVYIINYDILYRREPDLLAIKPRLFVFDEGQELKHQTATGSHRAASATRLVRQQMLGAVLLTGTPIMNRPAEMWRLLHLAEPKAWPRFSAFKERYLQGTKGREVGRHVRTGAGKVERLNELQSKVDVMMLRRLRYQVLKDLPPKSRKSVLVRLDPPSLAHYRAAEKDVVAWLRALGKTERANAAEKAQSIVKLTMLRRIAAVGKLRTAIPGYLEAWFAGDSREPLVIFGYHKDVMIGLWKICRAMGLRVTGIGGGESMEKRQRQVDAFQAGLADVFLAPIKSAGVGLNLQRACEALFVERLFTPSGMLQAEDRLSRLGQTRPVTITYLDAAGTVDEHLAHILEEKQRLIRTVIDDNDMGSESLETVERVAARIRADKPEPEQPA